MFDYTLKNNQPVTTEVIDQPLPETAQALRYLNAR